MERSAAASAAANNQDEYLEAQILRVKRVLAFSGELASALRQEFAPLWGGNAPGVSGAKATQLMGKVEAVQKLVASGKQWLVRQSSLPTRDALKELGAYPVAKLIEETKGLDALARELRGHLPAKPKATQPLSPPSPSPQPGDLMGWLRALVAPPKVQRLSGPLPASGPSAAVLERRQAFLAAIQLAAQVLDYVAPRMLLIRAALRAAGLPGPQRPWAELAKQASAVGRKAGVPASQLEWVEPLARMFYHQPQVAQKALIAENQFANACELRAEAEILQASLEAASPEAIADMLEQFNVGRFKGSLMPLSNLQITFRGIDMLQDLFPPSRRTS